MSQNEMIVDAGFNTINVSASRTDISLTGLKPYTNYTIHVRAIISTDLVGDADAEVLNRTHGTTPNISEVLPKPSNNPSASTIHILIPSPRQIITGKVL